MCPLPSRALACLVLLLMLCAPAGYGAARLGVSFPAASTGQLQPVLQYAVLQFATPQLADLFGNIVGPAVELSVTNNGASDTNVRFRFTAHYNGREWAWAVFGPTIVGKGSRSVWELSTTGMTEKIAADIISEVRANPKYEVVRKYLGDFGQLDIVDSRYNSFVVSEAALKEAFVSSGTLPNGDYRLEFALEEQQPDGRWVKAGSDARSFQIVQTTVAAIEPRGTYERGSPPGEFEFSVTGFPSHTAGFSAVIEVAGRGRVVWTSSDISVPAPSRGSSRSVVVAIPNTLGLIGGLDYSWTVRVKDAAGKTAARSGQALFRIANQAPTVSVAAASGGASDPLLLRRGDSLEFVALVTDHEDDELGYRTQMTWWVKPPGVAVARPVGTGPHLRYVFGEAGTYRVEMRATDAFGAVGQGGLEVVASAGAPPALVFASAGFVRDGIEYPLAVAQEGGQVRLSRNAFRPGDELVLVAAVEEAGVGEVRVLWRNQQGVFATTPASGPGGLCTARYTLQQPGTYEFSVEAADAFGASQLLKVGPLHVVPQAKPLVSITSPAPNTRLPLGSSITLAATVVDADDPSPTLRWYRVHPEEDELLGTGMTVTLGKYLVEQGTYVFRAEAIAMDPGSGQPKTEGTATITVYAHEQPNLPPTVAIQRPERGFHFTSGDVAPRTAVTFRAMAHDPDDAPRPLTYTWYVDDQLQPVEPTHPEQLSYTFAGYGSWRVKVVASDSKAAAEAEIAVLVTRRPDQAISVPELAAGRVHEFGQHQTLELTADYGDTSDVTVSWFLVSSGVGALGERFLWQGDELTIALSEAGDFTLRVVAADSEGRWGETTRQLRVLQNKVPEISVEEQAARLYVGDTVYLVAGSDVAGDAGRLAVRVTDPDDDPIRELRWIVGDVVVATGETFAYTLTRMGTHYLVLEAEDARGGVGVGVILVRAEPDLRPPEVLITSPAHGSRVPLGSTVRLRATVTDPEGPGRAKEPVWWVDGVRLPPGADSFRPTEERPYVVLASALDIAGNLGGASSTVVAAGQEAGPLQAGANEPPIIGRVDVPQAVESGEPVMLKAVVEGREGQRVIVTWFLEGVPVGGGSAVGGGEVSTVLEFPSPGRFRLLVRAEDAGGARSEKAVQLVVSDSRRPAIVSPALVSYSIPMLSNPVPFAAANVPEGAEVWWVSDQEGVFRTEELCFTEELAPGPHEITLWVDKGPVATVPIVVEGQVLPCAEVGIVVGWYGSPAIESPGLVRGSELSALPFVTIAFRQGATARDYSVAERTIYDVDVLRLREDDQLRVLLLSGEQRVYGRADDGKHIAASGEPCRAERGE